MDKEKIIDLFVKKMTGSLDENESVKYDHLAAGNSEFIAELSEQWKLSGKLRLAHKTNLEKSWEEFNELKSKPRGRQVQLWPLISSAAAVLVLAIGLAFYFLNQPETIKYATAKGETKGIILPDSSRITLNQSSQITLASNFNNVERKLSLNGKAFFDVKRDEERPFIISSKETLTKVLGTSFNIDANADQISINVVSGKVSFSSSKEKLILTKNMSAVYNEKTKKLKQTTTNTNELFWKTKRLEFDDTELSEVIKILEKHFQVNIQLQPETLGNCLFTGSFDRPALKNVLDVISISLKLEYQNKNNIYTLTGTGCAKPPQGR